MPETPDFESIARRILKGVTDPTDPLWTLTVGLMADQFRSIWNVRGAADIAKAELLAEARAAIVVSAIRSLDR
jgi:hypothetical protein